MWSAEQETEIARERAIDLVLQILRSERFLAKSTDQQQAILDEIVATGEVSSKDVYNLVVQEQHRQTLAEKQRQNTVIPSQPIQNSNFDYLTNLPYDVFFNIIDSGQIKGVDLVRLCSSSSKLREMCLKDRKYTDNKGNVYKTETQYVYRKLLAEGGIVDIPPDVNPAELYRAYGSSYYLSGFTILWNDSLEKLPTLTGDIFCKEVSTGVGYSLVLDIFGNVWIYLWDNAFQDKIEIRPLKGLKNIAQIVAGDSLAVFLTVDGEIFYTPTGRLLEPLYHKANLNIPDQSVISKIKKIGIVGGLIYILDHDFNLHCLNMLQSLITLMASNIKDFNCVKFSSGRNLAGYRAIFDIDRNQRYYNLVMITNSNEILAIDSERGNLKFSIPGVIPKKVIASINKILILGEDGRIYLYDPNLSGFSGHKKTLLKLINFSRVNRLVRIFTRLPQPFSD